eukprot:CAMPEP_0179841276 /NCGR_PEP_ID=MMETSP0982-20121206/2428_1 /TAXON_ID=483367 /ORGANISM="non described non described, Strain CCMP 2436" /LENGTH=68 /DNA_ID=CAMNT_0021725313 /DNA_START=303 /DNA_END=509 /DNA_ORIENTATION=+
MPPICPCKLCRSRAGSKPGPKRVPYSGQLEQDCAERLGVSLVEAFMSAHQLEMKAATKKRAVNIDADY